jgi:hypothetical protein
VPLNRIERLQIMLTEDELTVIDDWRFERQMPSRAAAIRELLKRGLAADGFALPTEACGQRTLESCQSREASKATEQNGATSPRHEAALPHSSMTG